MTVKSCGSSLRQPIDLQVILFSITLFLSASLMFTVQPMVGKMLLPLVGGSPSGWLVAMAYFQIALLVGYLLAHGLSYLPVIWHTAAVCILLFAGFFAQPVSLPEDLLQQIDLPEAFRVFLMLAIRLSLPFVALSVLSPSLQRLFSSSNSRSAGNPYFLFAASNLGSFGGLLFYPLVLEQLMGVSYQVRGWQIGFAALAILCVTCLATTRLKAVAVQEIKRNVKAPTWKKRLNWMTLAFIPSSLMLGVTAHITTDIGGVPFFWVLPLAIYLLTFVVAFAGCNYAKINIGLLSSVAFTLLVFNFVVHPMGNGGGHVIQMILPMVVFILMSLQCHNALAVAKPDPVYLTEFYLWVAFGGALGGVFNVFLAPFLLVLPLEFFLVALLGYIKNSGKPTALSEKYLPYIYGMTVLAFAATIGLKFIIPVDGLGTFLFSIIMFVLLLSLFIVTSRPKIFAATIPLLGLIAIVASPSLHMLDAQRNFFGVMRVYEMPISQLYNDLTEKSVIRILFHGSTTHGMELVSPKASPMPNAYYYSKGPLGDVMNLRDWRDVGIIGMGTGNTSCYKSPERLYTYYEIDPAVPKLATEWFDFIRECGAPEIKIGDGRKVIAASTNTHHDLLVIDAFTSDAIPVHLLTKEAFQTYFDRLQQDGIVMVHISNRYYDLRYPLSNVTNSLGLYALVKKYVPTAEEKSELASASLWVAIARNENSLADLQKYEWKNLPEPEGKVWTDDFSNLLSVMTGVRKIVSYFEYARN